MSARIAEFMWLEDAQDFHRMKGKDDYSICAGSHLAWAVMPKLVYPASLGNPFEPPEYVTRPYRDPDEE